VYPFSFFGYVPFAPFQSAFSFPRVPPLEQINLMLRPHRLPFGVVQQIVDVIRVQLEPPILLTEHTYMVEVEVHEDHVLREDVVEADGVLAEAGDALFCPVGIFIIIPVWEPAFDVVVWLEAVKAGAAHGICGVDGLHTELIHAMSDLAVL